MKTPTFLILLVTLGFGMTTVAADNPAISGEPLIAAAQNEEAEGMTRDDESPMDEFDPEEASWEAWLGPIVIGLFGFFLVLLIMRFTLRRKRDRDQR